MFYESMVRLNPGIISLSILVSISKWEIYYYFDYHTSKFKIVKERDTLTTTNHSLDLWKYWNIKTKIMSSSIKQHILYIIHLNKSINGLDLSKILKISPKTTYVHLEDLFKLKLIKKTTGVSKYNQKYIINEDILIIKDYTEYLSSALSNWANYKKEVEEELKELKQEEYEAIQKNYTSAK